MEDMLQRHKHIAPTGIPHVDELHERQQRLYYDDLTKRRQETDARGKETEKRVADAIKRIKDTPHKLPWLVGFEEASVLDDHAAKIDLWLVTDKGRLGLQIKTSKKYADKFLTEKKGLMYHDDVFVIEVGPRTSDVQIAAKLAEAYAFQQVRGLNGLRERPEPPRPVLDDEEPVPA